MRKARRAVVLRGVEELSRSSCAVHRRDSNGVCGLSEVCDASGRGCVGAEATWSMVNGWLMPLGARCCGG